MPLELTVSAVRRISDRLSCLSDSEYFLVADILSELGLLVLPCSDGGFSFESTIEHAKRLVVEALLRIHPKKGKNHEKAR